MKRFNWQIWAGLLVTYLGLLSFPLFFVRFPSTRDFPWVNLLLVVVAIALLFIGLKRAFKPERSKLSKILASVVALLSVGAIGLFLWSYFILAKQVPASANAPHVSQKAPDFSLTDSTTKQVTLSQLLSTPINGKQPRGVLLVFYRGYW